MQVKGGAYAREQLISNSRGSASRRFMGDEREEPMRIGATQVAVIALAAGTSVSELSSGASMSCRCLNLSECGEPIVVRLERFRESFTSDVSAASGCPSDSAGAVASCLARRIAQC